MKTNTESFSFREVPRVVQSVETESRAVVSRARWRGVGWGKGTYCTVGVKFQICKVRKS